MSRATVLARGRAAAEAGMADTCTIRRVTGATSDSAGRETPTYATLYIGKCRVQQPGAQSQREDVGEDHQLLLRLEVQLPVAGTEGLRVGDQVLITASAGDADLVARVFRIHDLAHKSEASARRMQVIERTGS